MIRSLFPISPSLFCIVLRAPLPGGAGVSAQFGDEPFVNVGTLAIDSAREEPFLFLPRREPTAVRSHLDAASSHHLIFSSSNSRISRPSSLIGFPPGS